MMKLEMTDTCGDLTITISENEINMARNGSHFDLYFEEIDMLRVMIECYKSALKEAHGG
jgi:hypothetical protein